MLKYSKIRVCCRSHLPHFSLRRGSQCNGTTLKKCCQLSQDDQTLPLPLTLPLTLPLQAADKWFILVDHAQQNNLCERSGLSKASRAFCRSAATGDEALWRKLKLSNQQGHCACPQQEHCCHQPDDRSSQSQTSSCQPLLADRAVVQKGNKTY